MENAINNKYEVIIVGGGPAGLSAAIYAARYKLNVLILSENMGGTAAMAHIICNYPSYSEVKGFELMQKFTEHVTSLGVKINYEKVEKISKKEKDFIVKTRSQNYKCKKIIFAGGTERIRLNIPGEGKLLGKGVSYCATCDSTFFKDKIVGVVGGGDAALTAALLLARYAKKAYIIYRKDKFFRGDPTWIDAVLKDKDIETLFNEEIAEIIGNNKVEKVKLKSGKELKLEGIFIEIGSLPKTEIAKDIGVETDKKGYIIADKQQRTNLQGFYAAGDVTNCEMKQIIIASAQGATAAFSAYRDLKAE